MKVVSHTGDSMTVVRFNLQEDISDAIDVKLLLSKPGAAGPIVYDATVDGTYVVAVLPTAALDTAGTCLIQVYVELPSWSGYSTVVAHRISKSLGAV